MVDWTNLLKVDPKKNRRMNEQSSTITIPALRGVDQLELISLQDNVVELHAAVDREEVQTVLQWVKSEERKGIERDGKVSQMPPFPREDQSESRGAKLIKTKEPLYPHYLIPPFP